jgi:hypothetical protein
MSKKAAKKTKTQSKKTAKKTKETQATKSKRAPSKGRKSARRVAQRADVGILSSIPFVSGTPGNPSFRDAFEKALGAPVANAVVQDDVGYDHTALDYALGQLNGTGGVTLIVTIGGVTPALRAANAASTGTLTIPFVSLVGSTLDPRLQPGAPQFRGAVDLQNAIYDPMRFYHLTTVKKFAQNTICLLQNGASALVSDENNEWPLQATSIISAYIDENTSAQGISNAFNTAFNTDISGGGFSAVIISGDSYYTRNAGVLVPIATKWATTKGTARRVVYPFVEYKAHGPKNHTIHGPELISAFALLGDKVANNRWAKNETVPQTIEDD